MVVCLVLLLLAAGCDKLFDITHIPDQSVEAGTDSTTGSDAMPGASCSNPAKLSSSTTIVTGLQYAALPEDRSFLITISAGRVMMGHRSPASPARPGPTRR